MTTQQHPAQFDWATELLDAQGHVTLSAKEAHEIGARLRSMGEKLKTYEDLDEAASDVQLLRMGYAAARLEIESLQARIKTMAEEHADELMVAHLDGRMRAAQPAGAQQPGVAYAAQRASIPCGPLIDNFPPRPEPAIWHEGGGFYNIYQLELFANATHALRASHGQAPAQAAPASRISLDFKQTTELLDMFGGKPGKITVAYGDGHTGHGLYAYYSDMPEEGSTYFGGSSDTAWPEEAPAAVAGPLNELEELNLLNKLIALGAKAAQEHAQSNSDDGHKGTAAYVQWQELRAEMGELIRNAYAAPTTQTAPQQEAQYNHGPQAETVAEAARDVGKWLNERPNRPIDLRHVAMLCAHAQAQAAQEPVAWYVTGCSRLLDEDEAKAEARHIGGTARAIPLYTAPQADIAPASIAGPMQFGGCPECGSRSCVARECSRTVSHAAQAIPGVQWQCGPQASGFTAPQADSQPAPDEATAMSRTRDLAEAGRWPSDWVEAYRRGYSDRASRAPADSATAPAATVIKKGADRQWMSERLGHLPDGIYSLYLAPPAQTADSVLEDAARLDWLDEDDGNHVSKVGKTWYTRPTYGRPYRKHKNLRAAIDAARAAQEGK